MADPTEQVENSILHDVKQIVGQVAQGRRELELASLVVDREPFAEGRGGEPFGVGPAAAFHCDEVELSTKPKTRRRREVRKVRGGCAETGGGVLDQVEKVRVPPGCGCPLPFNPNIGADMVGEGKEPAAGMTPDSATPTPNAPKHSSGLVRRWVSAPKL